MFVIIDHTEAKNHLGKYAKLSGENELFEGVLAMDGNQLVLMSGEAGSVDAETLEVTPGMLRDSNLELWAAPGNPFQAEAQQAEDDQLELTTGDTSHMDDRVETGPGTFVSGNPAEISPEELK